MGSIGAGVRKGDAIYRGWCRALSLIRVIVSQLCCVDEVDEKYTGVRKSLRQTSKKKKRRSAGWKLPRLVRLHDQRSACMDELQMLGRIYMYGCGGVCGLLAFTLHMLQLYGINNIHFCLHKCALDGITILQNSKDVIMRVTISSFVKIT